MAAQGDYLLTLSTKPRAAGIFFGRQAGNCFANDFRTLAEGKAHLVLPRFWAVRKSGKRGCSHTLCGGQLDAEIDGVQPGRGEGGNRIASSSVMHVEAQLL